MQFDVTIQRTEYREHVFRVEAENEDAAHAAAMDASCDYDFHDSPVSSADEDVTAVVPIAPNDQAETVDKFMVFDVESIGLHGEGFAVAWVVVGRTGERLGEGCLACDPMECAGTAKNRRWVAENVPRLEVTSPTKRHLRNTFWHEWRRWADQGAVLVADCAWPVEANFLSACVKLNHAEREWQGPYPLHDLASVLLAMGADALAVTERQPDELPAHHPLMDARQSARQLVACLKERNDRHPL